MKIAIAALGTYANSGVTKWFPNETLTTYFSEGGKTLDSYLKKVDALKQSEVFAQPYVESPVVFKAVAYLAITKSANASDSIIYLDVTSDLSQVPQLSVASLYNTSASVVRYKLGLEEFPRVSTGFSSVSSPVIFDAFSGERLDEAGSDRTNVYGEITFVHKPLFTDGAAGAVCGVFETNNSMRRYLLDSYQVSTANFTFSTETVSSGSNPVLTVLDYPVSISLTCDRLGIGAQQMVDDSARGVANSVNAYFVSR